MSETGAEPTVYRMLPLYEAKMIHHYDHRWATYEPDGTTRDVTLQEKQDPAFVPLPRYWVREEVVRDRLKDRADAPWFLGFRDIARSTDERTAIATLFPRSAVGHQLPLLHPGAGDPPLLAAVLSSFAHDYACRTKVGGTHLTFFIVEQLPVPTPDQLQALSGLDQDFIRTRVEELSFTSFSLGMDEVYGWAPARRELLRAELDAAMFHLYGLDRDEADYIMDTFPIVKRKDEAEHGEYRTKRLILEIYDDLARCLETGEDYQTRLDPPPADPSLRIRRPERSP